MNLYNKKMKLVNSHTITRSIKQNPLNTEIFTKINSIPFQEKKNFSFIIKL